MRYNQKSEVTKSSQKPHFLKTEKTTFIYQPTPPIHIFKRTTKNWFSIPRSRILVIFEIYQDPVFGESMILDVFNF